jgi:hypothetical protein
VGVEPKPELESTQDPMDPKMDLGRDLKFGSPSSLFKLNKTLLQYNKKKKERKGSSSPVKSPNISSRRSSVRKIRVARAKRNEWGFAEMSGN